MSDTLSRRDPLFQQAISAGMTEEQIAAMPSVDALRQAVTQSQPAVPPAAPPEAGGFNPLFQQYLAGPATAAVSYLGQRSPQDLAQDALAKLTGGMIPASPEPTAGRAAIAQGAAEFAVPQTLAQAGMMAFGPAGRAVGAAVAPASRIAPRLGAVLGGGFGGGVGAGASAEDPLSGAMLGAGGALGGEVLGAVGGKVLRSLPGAKRRIAHQDAAALRETMEEMSPGLRGAASGTTPSEELRSLTTGAGRTALGAEKERVIQGIEAVIGQQPIVTTVAGPLTLRQANAELTAIGEGLRHMDIADRVLRQKTAQTAYRQLSDEIRHGLETLQPGLGDAWTAGQIDYRKGIALIDQIRRSPAWRPGERGIEFNTPYVQKRLAVDPRLEENLERRLGPEDLRSLIDTLTRGAGPGQVDLLAPGTGGLGQAFLEWLRGRGTGTLGLPLAVIRSLTPNIGSRYVGQAPYALPPMLQNVLNYMLQRGASGVAEEPRFP